MENIDTSAKKCSNNLVDIVAIDSSDYLSQIALGLEVSWNDGHACPKHVYFLTTWPQIPVSSVYLCIRVLYIAGKTVLYYKDGDRGSTTALINSSQVYSRIHPDLCCFLCWSSLS